MRRQRFNVSCHWWLADQQFQRTSSRSRSRPSHVNLATVSRRPELSTPGTRSHPVTLCCLGSTVTTLALENGTGVLAAGATFVAPPPPPSAPPEARRAVLENRASRPTSALRRLERSAATPSVSPRCCNGVVTLVRFIGGSLLSNDGVDVTALTRCRRLS